MVVDPWIEGLWSAIKEALSKMASDRTSHLKENAENSATEVPDSSLPDVQLKLLSITDQQKCAPVTPDSKNAPLPATPPSGSAGSASQCTGVATPQTETCTGVEPAASLTFSLPPLSEASLNVPALPPAYLDVTFQDVDSVEQVMHAAALKCL